VADSSKHDNEPLVLLKGGGVSSLTGRLLVFKKYSAPLA
jgi:hypothetical protein